MGTIYKRVLLREQGALENNEMQVGDLIVGETGRRDRDGGTGPGVGQNEQKLVCCGFPYRRGSEA